MLHLQRLQPSTSLDPEVRDALGRALTRTGGRDWRDRSDALRSVAAQAGRLGDLPEAQLVAVLDFLGQHLSDGNLKVQMQDLEVGAQPPGNTGNDLYLLQNPATPRCSTALAAASQQQALSA